MKTNIPFHAALSFYPAIEARELKSKININLFDTSFEYEFDAIKMRNITGYLKILLTGDLSGLTVFATTYNGRPIEIKSIRSSFCSTSIEIPDPNRNFLLCFCGKEINKRAFTLQSDENISQLEVYNQIGLAS